MLFLQHLLLRLRKHEIQLFAPLCIHQRINKQVDEIHFLHLIHKHVNISQKLCRIYIINQINVQFMLP